MISATYAQRRCNIMPVGKCLNLISKYEIEQLQGPKTVVYLLNFILYLFDL